MPEKITPNEQKYEHIRTPEAFIKDAMDGIDLAPMSLRITPHILSCIDWNNPLEDPLLPQFIPLKSSFQENHPKLALDSLHEKVDSPVEGLVHRYTDKVLFLGEFLTDPFNITQRRVLTRKCSNIPLPPLLPVLHTLVLRRRRHPRGSKSLS